MKRYFKRAALGVSIAIFVTLTVVVYLYRVPIASWVLTTSQETTSEASPGHAGHGQTAGGKAVERKVLYWYDAMKPEHQYDKAGKAPRCEGAGVSRKPLLEGIAPWPENTIPFELLRGLVWAFHARSSLR